MTRSSVEQPPTRKDSGRRRQPVRISPSADVRLPDKTAMERVGKQSAPLRIALALLGVAGLCESAIRMGRMPVRPVMLFAITVAAVAALAVVANVWGRVDPSNRWRVLGAAATGFVWLPWTVRTGVGWLQVAVLGVATVVWSAYWLRLVRLPAPDGPPVEAQPVVRLPGQSIVELWNANAANKTGEHGPGPLAGAKVLDHKFTEHTEDLTIRLVPGKQHIGMVQARLPLLSTALGEPMENLIAESHPKFKDPSMIRFQVVTSSPIEETVYFDEPRWDDGRILLGPYADGDGDAFYRLYTRNRIRNGFILGTTGAGKSRVAEAIALTARAMGNTVIVYIDGQDGSSSSVLMEYALWSGGPDEVPEMLAGLEGIYRNSQKYNRAHRLNGFTPTPERPGILVIMDEAHLVLNAAVAKRLDPLARGGNKLGMGFLLMSQDSGVNVFGGLDSLRGAVMANKIVMRVESNIAPQLVPGLELDPRTLPEIPGYLYTVASKALGGRTAPGRQRYLPDAEDKAAEPSITVPTLEAQMVRYKGVQPHPKDSRWRAAGDAFLRRYELADERRAALLADLDEGDDESAPRLALLDDAGGEFGHAPAFPRADTEPAGLVLSESQRTVYDAIVAGAGSWQDVAQTTGLKERQIRNVVKSLETEQLVTNARNSYKLTDRRI
jgi:hypothetical protein